MDKEIELELKALQLEINELKAEIESLRIDIDRATNLATLAYTRPR